MKHSSFDATISALDVEKSAFGAATSAIARRSFDATISALDAETSAIVQSYRWYRRGISGDCGVGITPQMCNTCLGKVPISPWLVTLLHICGVIPTPQSPKTPRNRRRLSIEHRRLHIEHPRLRIERRRLRIERRRRCIEWPPRDRHAKRRRLRIERRYRRIEWRWFHDVHNVLRVFHVLLVVHDVSQSFTCVLWCFTMLTMFYV